MLSIEDATVVLTITAICLSVISLGYFHYRLKKSRVYRSWKNRVVTALVILGIFTLQVSVFKMLKKLSVVADLALLMAGTELLVIILGGVLLLRISRKERSWN